MADHRNRSLAARVAAHERWGRTPDRTTATAAARAAFSERFVEQARAADPEGRLTPGQLERNAASLRRAYFARLALRSAEVRATRREPRTTTRGGAA